MTTSKTKQQTYQTGTTLPDIFPDSWTSGSKQDFVSFRNLDHFIFTVSKLTQIRDDSCDISYKDALNMLVRRQSDFPVEDQESVRNLVRSNLHKRGLITGDVYEEYKYDVEGTTVGFDVGKYAAGEPDCVITPAKDYVDFFYELYISVSYPYNVENSEIRENVAKLLATIEELERNHIFIKVTLVLPIRAITVDGCSDFFSAIPLFSHKDYKSVQTMSSVVNERLLRKFYFAVLEDVYGDELSDHYGTAKSIEGVMNIGNQFNEVEFYESIQRKVGARSN